jgi:predicted Zn-ribbon and HTH transcriptional regulator
MGEVAEMVVMGVLCHQCGMMVDGEAVGYPRLCEDCKEERKSQIINIANKAMNKYDEAFKRLAKHDRGDEV